MRQQTLHHEHVPLLRGDVERRAAVPALDVGVDVVPGEELGHHQPLRLVRRHAQRRLAVLSQLVGVLAHARQRAHHVRVPECTVALSFHFL